MGRDPKHKSTRVSIPGTKIVGNRIYEEYLGSLQTIRVAYAVYDEMRRSDSQIKRTLRAITAPIMSGTFKYSAIKDDPELIKQALYKNNFFNEYPMFSWHETLNEILTMLPMGFSIFEPTYYTVTDPVLGKIITLKNLGFIKQSTIWQWNIVDSVVKSAKQMALSSKGVMVNEEIPGEDLLIFTNEREGDNFEGVSVLRAAYGNWVRKYLFSKIDMIGIEKMAIGTPVWYAPNSVLDNQTELDKLIAIAENYVGHEQAFLILSDKFKGTTAGPGFEIVKGEYDAQAVNTAVKREDAAIVDSVMASFMNIGTQRAGGNAQNEGQMSMFLESLTFVAKYVADLLDWKCHQMYVLNFGEPKERLRMTVSGITMDDAEKSMTVLRGYITAGVIKADDPLETFVRNNLSLPKADPTTAREFKSTPDYKANQDGQDATNPKTQTNPEKPNAK